MFRTEINIPESQQKINHETPIITLGSCFSDCMGTRFKKNKFDILSNPFGTVYNPYSIAKLVNYAIHNQQPSDETYTQTQGLWANYDFHSSFSHVDKNRVEENIALSIKQSYDFIQKAKWLIVTLGTSFVYEKADNCNIVANCHKLPAGYFKKKMLSHEQIIGALEPQLAALIKNNRDLNIILTVSPVRHIKDTIEKNSASKAVLRLACDSMVNSLNQVHYFPSYEIMMDDLRDYRFYKSDMLHPNQVAENYIWDKFAAAYFNESTKSLLSEWIKIKAAINHKPFNPSSPNHQIFVNKTIDRLKQLEKQLDIKKELEILKKQLI